MIGLLYQWVVIVVWLCA